MSTHRYPIISRQQHRPRFW